MRLKMDELLLIAGTGRNSGKTTMACAIIRNVSQHQPVLALKITPHFHGNNLSGKLLVNRKDLVILEETSTDTEKDSSRMLQSGAARVYFVMALDEQLREAITTIKNLNPENLPVVCESGGLIHFATPGLFLLMHRKDQTAHQTKNAELTAKADLQISFDGGKPTIQPETITYNSNKWQINPKY